jgi:endo-1,4-beta-xylanase
MNRRALLERAGAAGLAGVTSAAGAPLAVRAFEPNGRPAAVNFLKSLLCVQPDGRPFEILPQVKDDGSATLAVPAGAFEMTMLLPVRNFGQVYLVADNAGARYAPGKISGELLLNYEFARSRAAFVRRYVAAAKAAGVSFSPELNRRLERGEAALKQATAARTAAGRANYSNDSLAETMWAGEMAALERAHDRISRNGPRPGFLFGCNAFAYARSGEYARRFTDLLNFATLPFYRAGTEKTEGSPDYSRVDVILEKMAGTRILTKGHPLVWFHRAGVPEFLKEKSWPQLRESCRDYILRSVGRYRSRIHTWDVINEAHDWANDLKLEAGQLVEMTRLASETTRAADPTAFRVVNNCCTWAEYVATRRSYSGPLGRRSHTPLEYLQVLNSAHVPYEAVGLQVYYPARDMLEIERQIERYFVLGKPIHITELGISSSSDATEEGQNRLPNRNVWHGESWTEQIQADWAEQFYTICYSKP